MKSAFVLFALTFVLTTACADTSSFVRSDATVQARLEAAHSVYVALPDDGKFEDKIYASSGRATAEAIFDAFLRSTQRVRIGGKVEDREAALASAEKGSDDFIAFTTILHWEDRATEWSGRPDRMSIRIEILDAKTGARVDSAVLEGKSGLATFGGDHPQDLLESPVNAFVSSLYGVTEPQVRDPGTQSDAERSSNSW